MTLKLYNTLGKRKETFNPINKKEVRMYSCGQTVYDHAHLGNLRSYTLADILKRYLQWKDYKVKHVMNITDVGHMTIDEEVDQRGEDKIERAAKATGKTPLEIARFFEKEFHKDRKALNILDAWKYPRATDYIKEMIKIIQKLLKKGFAYKTPEGVYFDISKFPRYGKLSGNTLDNLRAGHRVEVREEKKSPFDFALWKIDKKHVMQWESPFGRGFPGWHIECSAMGMKLLGESFDIHTGGEDNMFPHHECEIAQSEGATGKTFVKYWIHIRHLLVNGEKMSKRLGNFYTISDLLSKGHSWKAIRYELISAHYRATLNFTEKSLGSAEESVRRLENFVAELKSYKRKGKFSGKDLAKSAKQGFEKALDDDLNTPEALASIFDFVNKANSLIAGGKLSKEGAKVLLKQMLSFDKVLGLELGKIGAWKSPASAPAKVKKFIQEREKYRKEKDWANADRIRADLKAKGYVIEDTKQGPRWRVTS